LAAALTVLWAAGGGIVLIAYRPGGPLDLLVGVTALLPLLVSVASIVWPPLVRSDRGSAGVFWLGLMAGMLLIPSIASVTAQVLARSSQPLLPSAEVVYPWTVALLATGLFSGLGISRQLIVETGLGKRRLASSLAFALVTTTVIGGIFAGVSLADDAALRDKPAAHSRFGPTNAALTPPNCDKRLEDAPTATLDLTVWGDVDRRSIGSVELTGSRAGRDVSWTAQVVRSDLFGPYGAGRTVLTQSLSAGNRATAEDRGLEYVEGARARHCRVAIDGEIFAASFPQVAWLVGNASLETWRGQLDFWVFGDGEVGMVTGSVNGNAQAILPHGLLATVEIRLTATDRGDPVSITPPRT
jgi:hypothetical protein